jgi:hypothetical protein
MIRHASAFVVAFCLSSASALAQVAQVTVTAASVEVRRGPSVVNPVIGHARQGTVLEITRDVGDWYRVSWPGAADGVGFVRKNTLRPASNGAVAQAAAPSSPARASASPVLPSRGVAVPQAQQRPAPVRPAPVATYATPSHVLGIGALGGGPMAASEIGLGMTARLWSHGRIGVQVEAARYTLRSVESIDYVNAMHLAPSALVTLPERLTDSLWVRPYVGVGGHMSRLTLIEMTPGVRQSDSQFGMQAFGGAELTLASMPRVALSADVGYRWMRESFSVFDASGLGVTIGAHWYIR